MFPVESVCRVKRFSLGGKRFANDEEVETELRKWLRQESKDLLDAADFDALVMRWDKCINVGGGYIEKYMFFQVRISLAFKFYLNL
jgi:hypothetical protein